MAGLGQTKIRFRNLRVQSPLQRFHLLLQQPHFGYFLHQQGDVVMGEWFGKIIKGAEPHGLNSRVNGGISRDDNDLQPGAGGPQGRYQFHPGFRPKPQIHKRQVEKAPV